MNTKPCPECGQQMMEATTAGEYCPNCLGKQIMGPTKYYQDPPIIGPGSWSPVPIHGEVKETINWPEKRIDIAARIFANRINICLQEKAYYDSQFEAKQSVQDADLLIEVLKKSHE